ncbi:MAG TPA: MFS transporter [Victivallales bacterium]|nr:MFS transporter [Victivallales bacterium]
MVGKNRTKVLIPKVPVAEAINEHEMTLRHWGLWLITGAGFALDGFDLFIIGVAMPLLMQDFTWLGSDPLMIGLIGAAAPIGAIIGAAVFGRLTDTLGRKFILLLNMIIFIIFSILCGVAWSVWSLIIFRFIAGIGIGGEYPVNSSYIAELIPKKNRKRMQVGNFSFQAIGAVAGALMGVILLYFVPHVWTWRIMLGIPALFAAILFFFRLGMPESSKWLASQGKTKKAAKNLSEINDAKVRLQKQEIRETKFTDIFKPQFIKLTVLSAVPWFLMDIAFYGIGIFTPIILSKLFHNNAHSFIEKDLHSIKSALVVDIFLVVGIVIAIILVKKRGMVKLSSLGFYGMGIGMLVLMSTNYALGTVWYTPMVFLGFVLFYLCVNAGPNPMTFMIPARVYPTNLRATGHGFSAAFAKAGATVGIVLLPWMQHEMGIAKMCLLMAIICIAGGIVTQFFAYLIIQDKQVYKYKKIIADLKGGKTVE